MSKLQQLKQKAEEKIRSAKSKWDGLPDDAKKTILVCGGITVSALYFYNAGYNWGFQCGKASVAHEKAEMLEEFDEYLGELLNSYRMPESFREDVIDGRWPGITLETLNRPIGD